MPASRSLAQYPLRMVYQLRERGEGDEPVQMLVSVPKKRFKHAVDRNRVKRQVREAYRHSKQTLFDALPPDKALTVAFVWLTDRHQPTAEVTAKVTTLVDKLAERL